MPGAWRRWASGLAAILLGAGVASATPDLIFSLRSSGLGTGDWPCTDPSGSSLPRAGSPGTVTINTQKWEVNHMASGDHFLATALVPNPCAMNGGSIVVAVRPIRPAADDHAGDADSIVDLQYDQMVLGIRNLDGRVIVKCKGQTEVAAGPTAIPNGQITILSLVVQSDGTYKVWANGSEIMNVTLVADGMTELNNSSFSASAVGGNAYDAWSHFNGNIGDVYVYRTALGDSARIALEASLIAKYGTSINYTINATSGLGGSISPVFNVLVPQNSDKSFLVTPDTYFDVTSVLVNGSTQIVSGPNAATYTLANVTANGTIAATFTEWPVSTLAGKVTSDGTTGVAGVVVTATGGREPYTATTAGDGTYSIRVKPGLSYTLVPRKSGYEFVRTPATNNFIATYVGTRKLVDLKVDPAFVNDAALTNWPNTGTLGGRFVADGALDTSAPTTKASIGGLKAVRFSNNKMLLRSTVSPNALITAPPAITGAGSQFSVIAKLFSDGSGLYSPAEQFFLAWSRRDGPADGSMASFGYGKGGAGAIGGWGAGDTNYGEYYAGTSSTVAPAWSEWNTVAMISDGSSVKIYCNGDLVNTAGKSFNFLEDLPFALGCQYSGNGGEGVTNAFNGAISSLEIWTLPKTHAEIAALSGKTLISGKVTLLDGITPVQGASVSCSGSSGFLGATSAEDGTYTFAVAFNDTYTLSASIFGYAPPPAQEVGVTTTPVAGINFIMAPINYRWKGPDNGNWSTLANWNSLVPGISDIAVFSDTGSAGATVTLDTNVTLKGLRFNNLVANTTIASPAGKTLTLATGEMQVDAGAHVVSAAVVATTPVGMSKTGPGKLTLTGNGTVSKFAVNEGELALGGAGLWTASTAELDGIAVNSGKLTLSGTAHFLGANAPLLVCPDIGTAALEQNGGTVQTCPVAQAWSTGNGPGVDLGGYLNGYYFSGHVPFNATYSLNGGVLITPSIGCIAYDAGGVVDPATLGSTAVLNLNGGILQASDSDLTDPVAVDEGTAHLIFNTTHTWVQAGGAKIDTAGFNNSIAVSLEHDAAGSAIDGGLTKTGLGTLTLLKASTYTGPTKVQGGVLACTTANSLAATALEISAGAKVTLGYAGTRTLPGLKLGTAVKGPGVYGPATDPAFFSATSTGTVTVGVANPYDAWAALHAGSQTVELDFDHDGVPNGVEYFMGAPDGFTANPPVVTTAGVRKVTWAHSAAASGIVFRVLTSQNLVAWTDVTASAVDSGGSLVYTLPNTTPKLFVRLEVKKSP